MLIRRPFGQNPVPIRWVYRVQKELVLLPCSGLLGSCMLRGVSRAPLKHTYTKPEPGIGVPGAIPRGLQTRGEGTWTGWLVFAVKNDAGFAGDPLGSAVWDCPNANGQGPGLRAVVGNGRRWGVVNHNSACFRSGARSS